MTRIRTYPTATLLLLVLAVVCCSSLAAEEASAGRAEASVEGRVLAHRRPLGAVTVYAYDMASAAMRSVLTDPRGRFLFDSLPAGLYKIVAYKQGFIPAVELLMRRTREESQYLELRIAERESGDIREAQQYWDARRRIPVDVLREVLTLDATQAETATLKVNDVTRLETTMAAVSGVEELGTLGQAQRTGAELGFRGALGEMAVGLDGRIEQLVPSGKGSLPDAEVRTVALHLESPGESKLSLLSSSGQLGSLDPEGAGSVGRDLYQLRWSGSTGAKANTAVTARYTQQSNFYQSGGIDPAATPGSSEIFDVEGSYDREVSKRTSLRTGLSFSQRSASGLDGALESHLNDESVDLYTMADSQVQNGVLVEYGLYSSLRDGALSLMPHGGVVIHLGSDWQARTTISHRLETEPERYSSRFTSAFYDDRSTCQQVGSACYEVSFARGGEDGGEDSLRVGAIHREFAETLQLYFSDDFFNRLESLFVVRGDELPEFQFSLVRRISPRILAKLESNYASGGGGIFYATDHQPYQNQVRYLVTSLDTRFQSTSTGVFVAFHHLEQDLNPIDQTAQGLAGDAVAGVEVQRLQLMLTQDLNALVDMAANLALRFNMELSRGATPFTLTASDEMHKKLTGGISVSF